MTDSDDIHGERILVRGVNWIGDAVMTIPALRVLRRSIPGASLSLLVKPWVAPLFEKDPDLDEIILYSDEYIGIKGLLRLARRLRLSGFSRAVLFQNAIGAAIIAFFAGIPRRLGYARDGRRFLLTDAVEFDDHAKALHHIDYYLNLVQKAGCRGSQEKPWLFLGLEERLKARKQLSVLKRPVVAINPGATYGSSKRWHAERFGDVCRNVIKESCGSVLLLGGPNEASISDEIVKSVGQSFVTDNTLLNLSGKTGLRELMAAIAECDILVTNDSGPMHIGYAVGTPVVAVFGSTSPEETGPVGAKDIVLNRKPECAPCFERTCRTGDLKCMELISPDEVYAAVKKLVRKRRAVFFDRDGTLCRDAHYLSKMEDLEIYPAVKGLVRLKELGLELIGVTNQSGIGRGLVDEEFAKKVNSIFIDEYGFRDFYYCPHHPDYHCSCRKPEPGMMIRAANEHAVDLRSSFVVGDTEADMKLARAAGSRSILVQTGKIISSEYADFTAADLDEATAFIISELKH